MFVAVVELLFVSVKVILDRENRSGSGTEADKESSRSILSLVSPVTVNVDRQP